MALQSEKSQRALRIRFYFDEGFSDLQSRKCWTLIDKATCPTLADLRKVVKRRFGLPCRKSQLEFKMDDFTLLAEESIEILKESDVVHVSMNENLKAQQKVKHESNSCHTKSSVKTDLAKPVKRRRVSDQKDKGLCTNRPKEEPLLYPMTFKAKADNTGRKTKQPEREVAVPGTSSNTTSTLMKLKETFKKKKKKKKVNKTKSKAVDPPESVSTKESSIAVPNLNNLSNNHRKDDNIYHKEAKSTGSVKKDMKETMKMFAPLKDHSMNMVGVNAMNMKGKKNELHGNRKQHGGKSDTRSSTPFHVLSSKDGKRETSCVTQLGPVSIQLYNNTSLKDIAIANGRKGSHLFFNSDEEEANTKPNGGVRNTFHGGVGDLSTSRTNISFSAQYNEKKPSQERFAPSKLKGSTISDRYSNSSVILTNTFSKDAPIGTENSAKEKVDVRPRKESTVVQLQEDEKVQKDYSTYPPLDRSPQKGDLIAYKVMELSLSYTPEISSFKEAAVLSYDPTTDVMELELSKTSLSRCCGDGHISRKFELSEDEEEGEGSEKKQTENNKVTHYFKELIDPKLIL